MYKMAHCLWKGLGLVVVLTMYHLYGTSSLTPVSVLQTQPIIIGPRQERFEAVSQSCRGESCFHQNINLYMH